MVLVVDPIDHVRKKEYEEEELTFGFSGRGIQ